jgi:hypothetical protein
VRRARPAVTLAAFTDGAFTETDRVNPPPRCTPAMTTNTDKGPAIHLVHRVASPLGTCLQIDRRSQREYRISYFRGLQTRPESTGVIRSMPQLRRRRVRSHTHPPRVAGMHFQIDGPSRHVPLGIAWNRSEEGHARYRSRPGYIHFAAEDQQRADREILPAAATEPNAEPIYQIGHAGSSLRLESVAISSRALTWLMRSCIYWFATATRLIAEASRTLHDPCFTGVPFALRIRPR